MSVGVFFASTGGNKLTRSVRSFRRMEPDLPIHVVVDTSSNTWRSDPNFDVPEDVLVMPIVNDAHIDGTLNAGTRWMKDLGFTHACLFHDDLVFSPLPENRYHVSRWFDRMETSEKMQNACGLSFGHHECLVYNTGNVKGQSGAWQQEAYKWDLMDLESEGMWRRLCPDGIPTKEVEFVGWYANHEGHLGNTELRPYHWQASARLGPTGAIYPIDLWEKVGGFDEKYGIHYDTDYPAACAIAGSKPVLCLPNTPHLHLHNLSIGFADPSFGKWGSLHEGFQAKYGKSLADFWQEHQEWLDRGGE